MKSLLKRVFKSRIAFFIIGVAFLPTVSHLFSFVNGPSAKGAMGYVGFYEEEISLYTFLGDNEYSLKFPGDYQDFERFAKKMRLGDHKVNDNLYKNDKSNEQWIEEVSFYEDGELTNIHYSSSCW